VGKAAFEEQVPFLGQELRAAAVICRTRAGALHLGLLYVTADGGAAILHLGWEDNLSDVWKGSRLWAAPIVEPERLTSVAGMCRRIWNQFLLNRTFPYGLGFSQETRFTSDGKFQPAATDRGLTCATFVLAVFNSVGLRLVDEESWPVRRDQDEAFILQLTPHATREHLACLRADLERGARRIQPQEVVGAFAVPPPASFNLSVEYGDCVVAELPARPA